MEPKVIGELRVEGGHGDVALAAQDRMVHMAARPGLVVPGHDPKVFARFAAVKPGVARIE